MAEGSGSGYDFAPKKEPSSAERDAKKRDVKPDRSLEKTCPHCGFRYRGKLRQGKCPECAGPIEGIQTDLLQFSDPRWLSRTGTGWIILALGFAVIIVGSGIVWKGRLLEGTLLEVVGAWISVFGAKKGSKPEPGTTSKAFLVKAICGCAWATAFLWTIVLLLVLVQLSHGHAATATTTAPADGVPISQPGMTPTVLAILIVYALETVLLAIQTRTIAMRIPNDSLSAQSLNLGWLMPATCVVTAILYWIAARANLGVTTFCALPLVAAMGGWGIFALAYMGLQMRDACDAAIAIEVRKAEASMKK